MFTATAKCSKVFTRPTKSLKILTFGINNLSPKTEASRMGSHALLLWNPAFRYIITHYFLHENYLHESSKQISCYTHQSWCFPSLSVYLSIHLCISVHIYYSVVCTYMLVCVCIYLKKKEQIMAVFNHASQRLAQRVIARSPRQKALGVMRVHTDVCELWLIWWWLLLLSLLEKKCSNCVNLWLHLDCERHSTYRNWALRICIRMISRLFAVCIKRNVCSLHKKKFTNLILQCFVPNRNHTMSVCSLALNPIVGQMTSN